MNANKVRQFFVILATVAVIAVNALANALPINDLTTGEISDRFEVFFVPAGYVFSIWGLIYLGLVAFSIYQARPSQANNNDLSAISAPFLLSSLANISWILLWHYENFPLTIIAMLTLLGSLIAIYLRLNIGRAQVSNPMKWFVHLPFSIFLGWITVATIANMTSLLDFWEWGGWGIRPEAWTFIMLAAAVIIGAAVSLSRRDGAFAAVLIWAFAGIAIKQSENGDVAAAAWAATVITAIGIIVAMYQHYLRRRPVGVAI
jgi:hypothetical protein